MWSATRSSKLTKGVPNFFSFLKAILYLLFSKEEHVLVFVVTSGYLGLFLNLTPVKTEIGKREGI